MCANSSHQISPPISPAAGQPPEAVLTSSLPPSTVPGSLPPSTCSQASSGASKNKQIIYRLGSWPRSGIWLAFLLALGFVLGSVEASLGDVDLMICSTASQEMACLIWSYRRICSIRTISIICIRGHHLCKQ